MMRCLIAGMAKSGTTAALYAVAEATKAQEIYFEEAISSMTALPEQLVAKIIFEHENPDDVRHFARQFDKRILILRDPRDNIISRLLYSVANRRDLLSDESFITSFIELLRKKQEHPASVDLTELLALRSGTASNFLSQTAKLLQDLLDFHTERNDDWFVLRYEDFVSGKLEALSAYLGAPVIKEAKVDQAYSLVARTKGSGDWKNWFTKADIRHLKPALQPFLEHFGYADDWDLNEHPQIQAEHSWDYVARLVAKRREHFHITMEAPVHCAAICNICGGMDFMPGPSGRITPDGKPPACRTCGSLERHRAMRSLLRAMPLAYLAQCDVAYAGTMAVLEPSWFKSCAKLDHGKLDAEAFACLPKNQSHVLLLEQVFEFIEDDRAAFSAALDAVKPDGMLVIHFAGIASRRKSQQLVAKPGRYQLFHQYGADLATHFDFVEKGVCASFVHLCDEVTGQVEPLLLLFKNESAASTVLRYIHAWDPAIKITDAIP